MFVCFLTKAIPIVTFEDLTNSTFIAAYTKIKKEKKGPQQCGVIIV